MDSKRNATVGFWVFDAAPEKITHFVELYFSAACMYNINFFAFSAKDVDINNKTINGVFWEDGQYIRKSIQMPLLFDFRLGSNLDRNFPDILTALRQNGYQVSRRGIGEKNDVSNWLLNGKYAEYVIETQNYVDCSINEFLEKHSIIIFKPSASSSGKGIYKVEKKNNETVRVQYLTDVKEANLNNFILENHDIFMEKRYLVQSYINSTAQDGSPIDIRLNVARGKKGQWRTSILYIRLGGANYIGTNMGTEQRSHSIIVEKSLSYQLGEIEGKRVYNEVKEFAREFPEYFQKKLKFIVPELAIDIGIDRNNGNKLKIFEVGVSPGHSAVNLSTVPSLNIQFYKYLIDEKWDLINVSKKE